MRKTILNLFRKLWGPQTASWRVLAPGRWQLPAAFAIGLHLGSSLMEQSGSWPKS